MTRPPGGEPVRVFVHLAHGLGARTWEARWQAGQLIGINDRLPYGYFHAADHGCAVTYSEDEREGRIGRLVRLAIRAVLGFDLLHAYRNRGGIGAADVVWTHTESQHLAIACLFRTTFLARGPRLLAQSVWLFDRWPRYSSLRKRLVRSLISQADVLTVHSPENLEVARTVFPDIRSELVLYGITAERKVPPRARRVGRPIRILSAGNDVHRDWETLVSAVGNRAECEVRIASGRLSAKRIAHVANVTVVRPATNDDLFELYRWADMLVLPVKPNLHASGITVIQEAALLGVPVVCTDTGGLRAYFSDDDVAYVPACDAPALRRAILDLASDDGRRWSLAERAQARMGDGGLSSRAFARRHVELSRELLLRADCTGDAAQGRLPDVRPSSPVS